MAGHEADLFIRKIMHAASLWDDVSDEFMALLKSAFLVGLVRITVEDTRPALAVSCHLNRPGILELRSVIRENDPESLTEDYRPQTIIQIVKYSLYRCLST